MTPLFTYRLRELDLEVEQLRAALAVLQRHLATRQPGTAAPEDAGAPAARARTEPATSDEYLRAYT